MEALSPVEFLHNSRVIRRADFEIRNGRGQRLQCSWWQPVAPQRRRPCVLYLHGSTGCRSDCFEALPVALSLDCTVLTLDMSGSGMSDGAASSCRRRRRWTNGRPLRQSDARLGEYITLGYHEREDVEALIEHVRRVGTTTGIGMLAPLLPFSPSIFDSFVPVWLMPLRAMAFLVSR
jgi:hypothetical protein